MVVICGLPGPQEKDDSAKHASINYSVSCSPNRYKSENSAWDRG